MNGYLQDCYSSSWNYGDTRAIVTHEIDFADSIVHGEFLNFYKPALDRMKFADGAIPVYDFPVNLVLGIWAVPMYLLGGSEYNASMTVKTIYGKSLFFFAFLLCTFLVYKICRELELDEDRSLWGAFIYFTSTMAINSICLIGNCDALGAALTLPAILAYIRKKDLQCFLWFMIAFPFKQHAAFIYLPLLLLRNKNIFRVAGRFIVMIVFNTICNIPYMYAPEFLFTKNNFSKFMFSKLVEIKIPFLADAVPIFVVLYGLLCVYCYMHEYPQDKHEQNSLTLIIASLGIGITLSTIKVHNQWFLQLVPYLAIACVYYGKAFKDVMMFETIGGISLLGYQYLYLNLNYSTWHAIDMLMYKLLINPADVNASAKFPMENGLASGLSELTISGMKDGFGAVYVVCMIALIFMLCKPKNVDTQSRINIRPYALTRMFMNFAMCYVPLMKLVIEVLR